MRADLFADGEFATASTPQGEKIFNALSTGGTVQMPYEKTFWSAGFGMCVDKFGVPWMINCEQDPD